MGTLDNALYLESNYFISRRLSQQLKLISELARKKPCGGGADSDLKPVPISGRTRAGRNTTVCPTCTFRRRSIRGSLTFLKMFS